MISRSDLLDNLTNSIRTPLGATANDMLKVGLLQDVTWQDKTGEIQKIIDDFFKKDVTLEEAVNQLKELGVTPSITEEKTKITLKVEYNGHVFTVVLNKEALPEKDTQVEESQNKEPENEDLTSSDDVETPTSVEVETTPEVSESENEQETEDADTLKGDIIDSGKYEKLPTSSEDVDAIYDAMTKAEKPIVTPLGEILNWDYSDELFYDNIQKMLKSENPVVKQFAQIFNDAINKLQLNNRNEAGAFIHKVFSNTQITLINALLYKEPEKAFLSELDKNKDGSFFDELIKIINIEAAKIKVIPPEKVENATTIDMDNLFLTEETKSKNPFSTYALHDNQGFTPEYVVENLSNMLLSNDPGARKLGNILKKAFQKYQCVNVAEKVRLTQKILSIINEKATNSEYNGFSLDAYLREDTFKYLDQNTEGNVFDAINKIIESEDLKNRYESMSDDFWDMKSFFKHANTILATSSEEYNRTRTTLTNLELLELSKNDDSGIYGSLRRNFNEIDTNKDGILSYDEIERVVGSGFKDRSLSRDGFVANMDKIDEVKAEEYAKLSNEEKLEKVIEEAIKYCKERGLYDHLLILASPIWDIKIAEPIGGAAADTNQSKKRIRIKESIIQTYDFYTMVSVLMHELTHACYPEKGSSNQEEYDANQIEEDYLDTVGRGAYKTEEEAQKIKESVHNSSLYDNNRENNKNRKKVWAQIKDWYD